MVRKKNKMKRKHSYKQLYRMVYGGEHEGDKGLLREYNFMLEVLSGWRSHADFLAELMKQDRAAIQRIRDLHKPVHKGGWMEAEGGDFYCFSCVDVLYPCSTRKALNSEQG